MEARIRRTSTEPRPQGIPGWTGSFNIQGNPPPTQVAAFYLPVSRDWPADDEYSRLLKFPSGELLSRNWLESASPKVSVGAAGQIDELKAFAGSKGRFRLLMQSGVGDNTLENFFELEGGGNLGTDGEEGFEAFLQSVHRHPSRTSVLTLLSVRPGPGRGCTSDVLRNGS